jgi:phosphoribosyl 1,2-cyclic phosphate phosphodiesterase
VIVTFLGTGTSMGVPVAGGFGMDRMGADPRNQRSRCSIWVRTKGASILIDASPEFRVQSLRAGLNRLDAVLLTHEHMDHVSGLDDLRSFCHARAGSIPLHASDRVLESIQRRFDYMFGPNRYAGSTDLTLHEASSPFMIGDALVTPLPILHGELPILGYRINDLAYLTDLKSMPESTYPLLDGCRLVVMGALRRLVGHPSHCTVEEAVDMAGRIRAERFLFIHMNSSVDHGLDGASLPPNTAFAFDQQVVWV